MSAATVAPRGRIAVPTIGVAIFFLIVAAAVATNNETVAKAAPMLLVALVALVYHRRVFAWRPLLAGTVLIILWIPIRRYELPGSLPFKLEPYRLTVMLLAVGWTAALLVDRRTRLRGTFMDGALLLVPMVAASSVALNGSALTDPLVNESVWKTLTFLLSYIVFFYVLVSALKSFADVDFIARVLVSGAAVVAFFALVEARLQFNVFNHLSLVIPGLTYIGADAGDLSRGGHMRVLASAQHPIPLSAMMVMLVPMGIYLGYTTRQRRWWLAVSLLVMAALATLSRTGVVMLVVVALIYLWLRPGVMKRLLPYVPVGLVLVHFALPGTLGSFKELFFPAGGLVAEQSAGSVGSSRGASFGEGVGIVAQKPVIGSGFGTRITDDVNANSFITDDQWLSTAMETGLVGVLVWLLVFLTAIWRMGRAARRDPGPRGWLLTGTAAAVAAFAVGMATYDAFSFIQVTFVLYLVLALGSVAVSVDPPVEPAAD